MKKIDFLALDGRSLRTFLVVLEEMSISRAAARLDVTQSAVSHLLDKLRLAFGDPLFVRAGRGIAPTQRAQALREPVQQVLDGLKGLTDERVFDPLLGQLEFTIAANDFQRDLIFPGLLRKMAADGVDVRFRFISSGIPALGLLRQARCQLIVTPFPPDGPDIYQARLFRDRRQCFYDGQMREAPTTIEEFCSAEYVEVRFEDEDIGSKIIPFGHGMARGRPRVSVPNFSALAAFLKETRLISVQLGLMGQVSLKGFASAPLPFDTEPMDMYLAWHKRDHKDPAHEWLRRSVREYVDSVLPRHRRA